MPRIEWDGGRPADAAAYDMALDPGPAVNPIKSARGEVLNDGRVRIHFESWLGRGGWVPRSDAAAAAYQAEVQRQSDAVAGSFTVTVASASELAEAVARHYSHAQRKQE